MELDCCNSDPDEGIVEAPAAVIASESQEVASESPESTSANHKADKKSVSQIRKPPRERSSPPLNWFPRRKTDSFLKRKIQLLQEKEGMNSSLDETLGSANPHYTRIAREKIAAQEAAKKAMKARKAAMIEASWCRILLAARIHSKEAEEELEKAEREVEEAFEEAAVMGVMMYDRPDCPRRSCEIETSSIIGGVSSHMIAASFETAFEVDKEVAMAVKNAFIHLAKCPSSSEKEEFKELFLKISENPEEPMFDSSVDHGHLNSSWSVEESSKQNLVRMIYDRLRCLSEDQIASLAVIVATTGLNAALEKTYGPSGPATTTFSSTNHRGKGSEAEIDVPSLDKFLVKHVSRLEKEVQEAKDSKKMTADVAHRMKKRNKKSPEEGLTHPDLGSILVKHVSRLEKEIHSFKDSLKKQKVCGQESDERENVDVNKMEREGSPMATNEILSKGLDMVLVKHVSTPERETMPSVEHSEHVEAVLVNHQSKPEKVCLKRSTDEVLTENQTILDEMALPEMEKSMEIGLDQILIKHQSKLEKANLDAESQDWSTLSAMESKKKDQNLEVGPSLEQILVKRQPNLEKAKMSFIEKSTNQVKPVNTWREARDRKLQEEWGSLTLASSLKPHLSRLEREKAAWKRAEEEEVRRARAQ